MATTPSTASQPELGRRDAALFTASFKKGTVGQVVHAAVEPLANGSSFFAPVRNVAPPILAAYPVTWPLIPFVTGLGDFASGSIGTHYRARAAALAEPATDANLEEFAKVETAWWRRQSGLPFVAGLLLGAEWRADVLKRTKQDLIKSGEFPSDKPK